VVAGDARGGIEVEEDGLPIAARVELLVRPKDLIVQRMIHFGADGREAMRIEIMNLVLDPTLDKASFVIELPPNQQLVDVMDHLPAATQINALLERFEESKQNAEKDGAEKDKRE